MARKQGAAASDAGAQVVRRAADKDTVLKDLVDRGSPFPTYRDALVFAAALGWHQKRRNELKDQATGEPIRWSTMTNRLGTEDLVDMIAAAASDDPQILTAPRLNERIRIFEEYANGGLEYLKGALASRGAASVTDVVNDVVRRALRPPEESEAPELDAFVQGLELD